MTISCRFTQGTPQERIEDSPPPGELSCTDDYLVARLRLCVEEARTRPGQLPHIARLVSRILCSTDLIVWVAQDEQLLEEGLADLMARCARWAPEPWAGFLRWCSDPLNTDGFLDWPPYVSPAGGMCPQHRPAVPSRRERRAARRPAV
jgi:hypothetical protein